jgi:tungstate transport system substrate-binding protein
MPFLARRHLILHAAALAAGNAAPTWVAARPASAVRAAEPRVGIDPLLLETGLAARWQTAMQRDMGWAAQWLPLETGTLLRELEQGQIDAGLYLSHPLARQLDKDGLIHHRSTLARTEVYLVGPPQDPAGVRGSATASQALQQILAAQAAGAARWQSGPADSALAALADALTPGQATRKGGSPGGSGSLSAATVTKGNTLAAYRLVSRAVWDMPGQRGGAKEALKVWFAGDPALHLECEVALPFRGRHPTAKLLVSWLQWPLAQDVVKAARPGWMPVGS